MPGFYRKRRFKKPGLNKNQMKVQRGLREEQRHTAAGQIGARYPEVTRLRLEIEFLDRGSTHSLGGETRELSPEDSSLLEVPCPGGCGGGKFNLTEVVKNAVEALQEHREGRGACQTPSYADPRALCGTELRYRLHVSYR